jgi:hypothetical protein
MGANLLIVNKSSSSKSIGGINSNYWEVGSAITTTTGLNALLTNITYTPSSPVFSTSAFTVEDIPECGISYEFPTIIKQLDSTTLTLTDTVDCKWLKDRAERNDASGYYQRALDSGKLFIELCAEMPESYTIFVNITYNTGILISDSTGFLGLTEWLKKVLYYNTKEERYYCTVVEQLFDIQGYLPERGGLYDVTGALAIMKYINESGKCKESHLVREYDKIYRTYIDLIVEIYRDSVQDSLKTPLDTTLPSLEDLGLGILRGNPNEAVSPASYEERIGELIATRNPFTDILELKYRLEKSEMVRIDVYDLLGRAVYSEGQGYKAEGEHMLSLQSKGWSSGSYYVRLSSPSGEVKTVKVVKE